jgi:predicted transcriptional regulator
MANPMAVQRAQGLLGENMMRLRLALGLTQQEAAQRAGLHWRHLQKIETGKCNCCLSSLVGIAYALETTTPELFAPLPR